MAAVSNSLFNKYSRYVGGGVTESADGFVEWWERTIFEEDPSDISYVVENFYEGRLDMIASLFYNEPRWWWLIAQYNNILNPAEEITAGRILRIPAKSRLPLMLGVRQGGIPSKKQPVQTISPIIS